MPTRLRTTALAALASLVAAPCVVASPAQVIADYRADGRIDGAYSLEDLNGALRIAYHTRSASYGATADAIRARQSELVTGIHRRGAPSPVQPVTSRPEPLRTPAQRTPSTSSTPSAPGARPAAGKAAAAPAAAPRTAPAIASSELPSPPVATPGDRVPTAFVALSGLAGVLVLGGIGAGVARRVRHDDPSDDR